MVGWLLRSAVRFKLARESVIFGFNFPVHHFSALRILCDFHIVVSIKTFLIYSIAFLKTFCDFDLNDNLIVFILIHFCLLLISPHFDVAFSNLHGLADCPFSCNFEKGDNLMDSI